VRQQTYRWGDFIAASSAVHPWIQQWKNQAYTNWTQSCAKVIIITQKWKWNILMSETCFLCVSEARQGSLHCDLRSLNHHHSYVPQFLPWSASDCGRRSHAHADRRSSPDSTAVSYHETMISYLMSSSDVLLHRVTSTQKHSVDACRLTSTIHHAGFCMLHILTISRSEQ